MTAAGLFGAAIPLILRALGRDPAQSASIFLTTVTDVVGFAAFLGVRGCCLPMLAASARCARAASRPGKIHSAITAAIAVPSTTARPKRCVGGKLDSRKIEKPGGDHDEERDDARRLLALSGAHVLAARARAPPGRAEMDHRIHRHAHRDVDRGRDDDVERHAQEARQSQRHRRNRGACTAPSRRPPRATGSGSARSACRPPAAPPDPRTGSRPRGPRAAPAARRCRR